MMDEKGTNLNLNFLEHVKMLIQRVEPMTKSRDRKVRVQAIDVYLRLLEFAHELSGYSDESAGGVNPLARRVRLAENRI